MIARFAKSRMMKKRPKTRSDFITSLCRTCHVTLRLPDVAPKTAWCETNKIVTMMKRGVPEANFIRCKINRVLGLCVVFYLKNNKISREQTRASGLIIDLWCERLRVTTQPGNLFLNSGIVPLHFIKSKI